MIPVFSGLCLSEPYRVALEPYGAERAPFVRARRDEETGETSYASQGPDVRHVELSLGGFAAVDDRVLGPSGSARLFLDPAMIRLDWTRLYEPGAPSLGSLDLFRAHFGSNLVGAHVPGLEIYPQAGVLILHGREATPAFDTGLEARVLPARPFVIRAESFVSIFERGPVLFDTRLEPGVTFSRFEVRGGLRWLYQPDAPSFIGPSAELAVRF